jgi:hypothetical protein
MPRSTRNSPRPGKHFCERYGRSTKFAVTVGPIEPGVPVRDARRCVRFRTASALFLNLRTGCFLESVLANPQVELRA